MQVAERLRHHNIVRVFGGGYDSAEDQYYVVMELLTGGSLRERLDKTLKLKASDVLAIVQQVAEALHYAHGEGVVHRDIKPSNILFRQNGDGALADFGIAKIHGATQSGVTSHILGTTAYLSPEQCRGEPATKLSDIYALGVVMYEMLTGTVPFKSADGNPVVVLEKHKSEVPTPPRQLNPSIPPAFEAVVLKALAKEPEQRYHDAMDMVADMKAGVINTTQVGYGPDSPTVPNVGKAIAEPSEPTEAVTLKPKPLKRLPLGAIAATAAILSVLGVLFLLLAGLPSGEGAGNNRKASASSTPIRGQVVEPTRTVTLTTTAVAAVSPTLPAVAASTETSAPPIPTRATAELPGQTRTAEALNPLLNTLQADSESSLAFSPDGQILASGSNKLVELWRVADGTLLNTLEADRNGVYTVAFSPDGQIIASGSNDGTVKLWKAADGTLLNTLKVSSDQVHSVAFSPDGQTLASGSYGSDNIKLWRVADGTLLKTIVGNPWAVHSVAFSPDGQTLASGTEIDIKLWRVADGMLLDTFTDKEYSAKVLSVAFSPDGKIIASGSGTGVKLWRVADGALLDTLSAERSTELSPSVAFSPDGKIVASNSYDGTVKLWRVADGTLLDTFPGKLGEGGFAMLYPSVAFSPDGKIVASNSYDQGIRLWRVP